MVTALHHLHTNQCVSTQGWGPEVTCLEWWVERNVRGQLVMVGGANDEGEGLVMRGSGQ